jgi:DNA-binding XRE family transcriptional regulator
MMTAKKVVKLVKKERRERAEEWYRFRKENLFTQKRLADTLGISRRTVQQIEAGNVTPLYETQRRFAVLRESHRRQAG